MTGARLLFLDAGGEVPRTAVRAAMLTALASLSLSFAVAWTMPHLFATDERAHLAYVEALRDGRLPEIDDPIEGKRFEALAILLDEADGTLGPRGDIWVANHPPLGHLLAVPPAVVGAAVSEVGGPPMAMRLTSGVALAVGVLGAIAVADALRPGRPVLAAFSGALVALTPMAVPMGGLAQTDAVAFAVATWVLAIGLRSLRGRLTGPESVLLVGLCAAAAATRAALVPLVGLVTVACVIGRHGTAVRRWCTGAACLAAAGLASGWFYARNIDRYGDWTGAAHLQAKFDRVDGDATIWLLVSPRFWAAVWQEIWGSFDFARIGTGGLGIGATDLRVGTRLVVGAVVLAVALYGALTGHRRDGPISDRCDAQRVWGIALAWCAISVVGVASFASGGGTPHPRYLLAVLPVVACVLVAGGSRRWDERQCWLVAVPALAVIDGVLLFELQRAVDRFAGPPALEQPAWTATVVAGAALAAAVALGAAIREILSESAPPP